MHTCVCGVMVFVTINSKPEGAAVFLRDKKVGITPYRAEGPDSPRGGFTRARYLRNREWEAALGAVAAFGVLALKLRLWP